MAKTDKYKSWNSSDFENYFSGSHRFGGSSDMFKEIRAQLKELKELDSMPVTKERAEGRRLLLEMIQETSAKYVRERSGAITSQGKERLEVAEALAEFCASEIPLMKSEKKVEYFTGKTFDDLRAGIDTNKMEELSGQLETIQKQQMTVDTIIKYTNTVSQYIPMAEAYLDDKRIKDQEMQEQVDTYKAAIGQMRDFRNVKRLVGERKGWADLNALRDARVEWNKPLEKTGANASVRIKLERNGKPGFFTEETYFTSTALKAGINYDFDKFISTEILKQNNTKDILTFLKIQDVMVDIAKNVTPKNFNEKVILDRKTKFESGSKEYEVLSEMENNPELLKKCADIINKSQKTRAGLDAGNLTNKGEIEFSRRNIAATRVAELLGIGSSLAHSEKMTVVIDGVERTGCFMEFAEGIDPTSRSGADFEKLAETEFKRNASYNRSESNLEILDAICGQMDRHGKNFFYQLSEKQPDGTRHIVGIQGIDNDLSFTSKDGLVHGKGVTLEGLTFIDAKLAENIRKLTPEKIEYALSDVLKPQELQAFKGRVDLFKQHLNTKMVEIDENGWELNEFDESKYKDLSQLDARTRNYVQGLRVFKQHDFGKNDWDLVHRSNYISRELKAAKAAMAEQKNKAERTAKADDIISQIAAKKEGAQPTVRTAEQKAPAPTPQTTRTSFADMTGTKSSLRNPGITIGSAAKTAEKKAEAEKQTGEPKRERANFGTVRKPGGPR